MLFLAVIPSLKEATGTNSSRTRGIKPETCSQIVFWGKLEVHTTTDDRQMRALTGLDLAASCALAEPFARGFQDEADAHFSGERPRQRRADSGLKSLLNSPEQKLLFILHYLKTYPTFAVLAATFGLPRSKACEHAHRLAQAPERTLRTLRALGVLPARAIDSLAQMQALFADVPMLLLDATEQPCHRAHAAASRLSTPSAEPNAWTASPKFTATSPGPSTAGSCFGLRYLKLAAH